MSRPRRGARQARRDARQARRDARQARREARTPRRDDRQQPAGESSPRTGESASNDPGELATRVLCNTPDVAAVVELVDDKVASFAGIDQRDADRVGALARELVQLVPPDGQVHVRSARGQVFVSQHGERLLVAMTTRRVQAASVLYDMHMAVRGELGE